MPFPEKTAFGYMAASDFGEALGTTFLGPPESRPAALTQSDPNSMQKSAVIIRFASRSLSLPLTLALAFSAVAPVAAQLVYYEGVSNGMWQDSANWSMVPFGPAPDPLQPPGEFDTAVFNSSPMGSGQAINLFTATSVAGMMFGQMAPMGPVGINGTGTAPHAALTIGPVGIEISPLSGAVGLGLAGPSSATYAPLFLSASQRWGNTSAFPLTVYSNVNTAPGARLTIGTGMVDFDAQTNFNNLRGGLTLRDNAKLRVRGDLVITGTLEGEMGTMIENSHFESKTVFVNSAAGTTGIFAGTIRGNPTAITGGQITFTKQGLGTQNISGTISAERIAVENGTMGVFPGGSLNMIYQGPSGSAQIAAGTAAGQNGVIRVDGGALSSLNGGDFTAAINVGSTANAQGFIRLSDGTVTAGLGNVQVAGGNGSYGAYTQGGGVTSAAKHIMVASGSGVSPSGDRGVVNLNGGTMNAGTGFSSGRLLVATANESNTGVFNANGGTLNADHGIYLGEIGNGTLNVAGGTVNTATGGLLMGVVPGSNGTANLVSGVINTSDVRKGSGTALLNLHGGTLAASGPHTEFMQGLTSAYVYANGPAVDAIIANSGYAITIGQNLLAPTGNGVSAAGLIVSGAGFLDTPLVKITGNGVGATAVANIDSNTGALTGFTVTNPGVGYTNATFSLLTTADGALTGGVGATAAITGAPTLVPNAAGDLKFSGTGITRLTGTNTYGTSDIGYLTNLQVDGTNSGGITTTGGFGTLSGVGTINGVVSLIGGSNLSPGGFGGADVGALRFGGSVSLDFASAVTITINDSIPGAMDQVVNTGLFTAGSARLDVNFTDTIYTEATSAADLGRATRYPFVTGPVSGMFGNATSMSGADLAALGLAGSQYEIAFSGQRFWIEQGSFNLVPIAPVAIPEPAVTGLLAGLAALGLTRRRR
jgi:fibronectin-binding autotransporter adhesin